MSVSFNVNRASISSFEHRIEDAQMEEREEIMEVVPEDSVNETTVTQKDLIAIAVRIEKAINEADDDTAIEAAEQLYQKGLEYVRNRLANSVRKEIPLQITLKIIKLLTKGEIQYCDALKEPLSAISALFAERVSSLALSQNRSIYPNVRIELLRDLAFVICGTPQTEVATRFEAKCCGAAVHEIVPIDERMKGVARDNALPLFKRTVTSSATLSPGPIVEPVVDLVVGLFKERPKLWYPEISQIRREFLTVTEIGDLDRPEIQSLMAKWNQSHKHAICFVQIFSRILKDPTCSEELKQRVLQEEAPSLETFSKFQRNWPIPGLRKFFSSWKVRYLSVKTFSTLIEIPKYRDKSIFSLASRLAKERDARVGNFLMELYQQDPNNQAAWKDTLAHLDPQEVKSEDRELKQTIQGMIEGIDGNIKKKGEEINQKREKLGRARKHAGGRIGEEEDPKTIEKQIENLQLKTDELRHQKEKLEKEISEFGQLQTRSLKLIEEAQKMLLSSP